jgi:ketosteroid isomerase-like protein
MKAPASILLAAVLAVSGKAACAAPVVQAEIQQQLQQMMQAANDHDTEQFMSHDLRSPSLVVYFETEAVHGWQAVHDQQLRSWDSGRSTGVYRLRSAPGITVVGTDLATSSQALAVTETLPDGRTRSANLVVTSVWKKLPVGWRIVQENESFVR